MSVQSLKMHNQVKANFLNAIKNKKIWIILLLVNVFGLPYAILQLGIINEGSIFSLCISAFALVVNVIMGMVIPFLQFDYCYDRTKVDMAYSLPLTRRQKFLSDFFSGLSMYVGAYVIQIILTYISTAITIAIGNPSISFSYYYNRFHEMSNVQVYQMVSKALLIILLMQIMLYTVTTFVLSCTGAIFEAVSAIIYTNILLASTIYVIYTLCANQLFGMDFSNVLEKILYYTSPLGGFFYLIFEGIRSTNIGAWAIGYLAMVIIYFLAAYFIMTRRKAESVGKPFVVRSFYHVILVAIMLHIGLLACYTGNSLVTFILMTIIFYLVVETITNRGFKKFGRSLARYGIIIACTLAIILTINKTECFGVSYKVADVNDVDQIVLNYSGLFTENYLRNVKITSKENIATILEVQQDLIDEHKLNKKDASGILDWRVGDFSFMNSYVSTDLQIKLEGKADYYRDYYISYKNILKLVGVELSDEYVDARIQLYRDNVKYLSVSDIFGFNNKSVVMETNGAPSNLLDEFFNCLSADLKEATVEEYLRPESQTKYRVRTNVGTITILDSYTNCMRFLEENNAFPVVTTDNLMSLVDNGAIQIYRMEEQDINTGYYCSERSYGYGESYMVNNFSADVEELLQKVQQQYVSEEPCYTIEIYGDTYVVPAKDSALVEKVITNDSKSYDDYYSKDYNY